MQTYTFKIERLTIEHLNLQRQQVDIVDLNLRHCERDDRAGYVIVQLRSECKCFACDGSGLCQFCGGNRSGCKYCIDGDCMRCDGSGRDIEWIPVYLNEPEWDSIKYYERAQKLLEKRYETTEPETIRDWWLA